MNLNLDKRKDKILYESVIMFAENGYEKSTIRGIAKKAGVKASAIYYYYPNKEELLKEIIKMYEEEDKKYRFTEEELKKLAKSKDFKEVLSKFRRNFIEEDKFLLTNMLKIFYREQYNFEFVRKMFFENQHSEYYSQFKKLIKYCIENNILPNKNYEPYLNIWIDVILFTGIKASNTMTDKQVENITESGEYMNKIDDYIISFIQNMK